MAARAPMKPEDIAFLYVRTNKERHRRWVRAAKRDNRSLSSWVSHQLELATRNVNAR